MKIFPHWIIGLFIIKHSFRLSDEETFDSYRTYHTHSWDAYNTAYELKDQAEL